MINGCLDEFIIIKFTIAVQVAAVYYLLIGLLITVFMILQQLEEADILQTSLQLMATE